jgi:hypothetical protein
MAQATQDLVGGSAVIVCLHLSGAAFGKHGCLAAYDVMRDVPLPMAPYPGLDIACYNIDRKVSYIALMDDQRGGPVEIVVYLEDVIYDTRAELDAHLADLLAEGWRMG